MLRTVLAAVAALTVASPAYAFPPSGVPQTTPTNFFGNGEEAFAIFAFVDAGDNSNLNLTTPNFGLVFNNQSTAPGTTVSVGVVTGPVVFNIENLSTGLTFFNNVADVDGNYHFFATTNYSDFGVGALDPAVVAAIAALPPGTPTIFVGVEDRQLTGTGTDFDYNDIIYVFGQIRAAVPSPATIALFGLGLVGLGFARRRA